MLEFAFSVCFEYRSVNLPIAVYFCLCVHMLGNRRELDFHLRILAEKASMFSFVFIHYRGQYFKSKRSQLIPNRWPADNSKIYF